MKALALSLLGALFLYGCASDEPPRDRQMAGDPTGGHEVAIDPVSHGEVRTDSAWSTTWDGRWYYFESRENQRRFESDPSAYVGDDGRVRPERYKVRPHEVR